MELEILDRPAWEHCDLCGHAHYWPWTIYRDWVEGFGVKKTFATGKKAGRPTRATEQTLRWEAIVKRHTE